MKPGNLRKTQGAKSGGSVSKDEDAKHAERSAAAGRFFASNQRKEQMYGKETVYF